MYAVIKTGGKQYRVEPGNVLKVESLDAGIGETVNFEEVLMIADGDDVTIGTPTIASAKVVAEVIAHGRAKKVEIVKFRRRKHHQKRTGHRQNFTQVQIQNINGKGTVEKKAKAKTKTAAADSAKDDDAKATAKKPAAKKAAPKKASATKADTAPKKDTATKAKAAPKKDTATKAKAAPKKDTAAKTKAAPKKAAAKETTEKKPAAKKPAAKKATTKKAAGGDDFTKVEGIGPKAAAAFNAAGLVTFADMGGASVEALQKILDESEGRFGAMNPSSWPKQAQMAADGKWDELKKWQEEHDGGIE